MSDKTTLVAHIHPFAPGERITKEIAPGQTVEQIVSGLGIKLGNPVAYVNGNRVIREAWPYRKAHEGDHVVVKVIPAGGQGSETSHNLNKASGWMFLAGAGLFIAGFFTGGATWGLIGIGLAGLGAGLGILTSVVDNALGSIKGLSLESSLSIRGGSNQTPTLGTKIPVILGQHLVTPYYGARPYTEIATVSTPGDTQYLRMLFCVGVGPLRLTQIKIGENILATNVAAVRNGTLTIDGLYTDVAAQIYQDGTNPSLYPNTVIEDQPNVELASGVEHWLTTAKNADKVDVDITFQSGLYKYSDDGTKLDHSVTVEVRRRAVGSGTVWASCTLVGTFAVTAKKAKTLRYTLNQVVTAGQYEVGMKRITADDAEGAKAQSVATWSAFRSVRTAEPPVDASIRGRYVFLALKIKATSQLSGVISQLNCIAESDVPVWDGINSGASGWSTSAVSQNPAALFLCALRGPMNPRPISDAAVDWPRLEALYSTCADNGWTCNAVLASETRLRDILAKIASTARATPTIRDGLYSVVVDEPKTVIAQHFTPRNVRSFSWTKAFADLPYGALVNFVSAPDGYDKNQRIVPYDEYTETEAEAKLEAIDLWGITDPELAYKHARYLLAVSKLRPEMMVFETDVEGIVCETGDLVVLSHDAIVVGRAAGRVKSVETDVNGNALSVTTDELVTMITDEAYAIRFRLANGSSTYALVSTVAGETNEIQFASPVDAASIPASGDLFTFGIAGIETERCIVSGIEMLEDLSCRIYVVDEAPGVHTADSGVIPEFVSRVSLPGSALVASIVDGSDAKEDPIGDAMAAAIAAVSGSLPPDNNVTTLTPSSSPNADGTVKVNLTWAYAQGSNTADGAYIYCKAGLTDPAPIDFSADPAEYRPMSADGTYTWEKILPVRTGGAAGAPIKYRFGVVAAKGVMLHADGVVEVTTPVDWTKIEFTGAIQFDENNFWNLVSGAFKVSDSSGDELSLDPGNGITLKARLLQLETAMSRMYSTIEFYRDRLDYLSPSYGKQRVAIGEGALYFDKYTTAWQRNGGFHAVYGDVGIIGNLVKSLGTSSYSEKTRAQIASGQSIYNTAGCPADATHIIGAFVNGTRSRLVVRVGTISGDAISWGAEQDAAVALYVTQPRVIFVTATRFVVVMSYPGDLSKIMYTYGTYSGGAITISTSNVKYLTVAGMHGNLVMSKTAVLGSCVGWCADTSTDPKTATLIKFAWDDSALAFTQGDSATITDYAVYTYGDIDMLGDYLFVTMRPASESRWRFSLFDPLTLAAVASDVLADSVVSDLTKVPGLVSGRMALLHSGSQYYLVQVDDPAAVMPTTVTVAPSFVVPDGIASRGVAFDGQDYYCTPFDTVEYTMARVGAGIVASGVDPTTGFRWEKYGNGLIKQGGYVPASGAIYKATRTFPTPFKYPPHKIGATAIYTSGNMKLASINGLPTATTFSVVTTDGFDGIGGIGFYWWAEGY